ncbi:MAG: sulfur oxidation c-type cytochrome SoxA [Alphaproteobacteria bacterium]
MRIWFWMGMAVLLAACAEPEQSIPHTDLDPGDVVSGYTFLTPETQAQQDDDFLNPGFLWIDRGADLFASAEGVSRACVACHTENDMSLQGAAAGYPAIDEQTGALVNLEGRINLCRSRHQDAAPLDDESEDLLSLTAYVAHLSRGQPVAVSLTGRLQPYYDKGRDYFFTRRGQLNLSCHHCHDLNWGRQLRGDTISQGHGNGFPTYRLEWETLGSLHRRFRDCDAGVRAEPKAYGSEDYTALELYLAIRGAGLPIETPAVRR